MKDIKITPTPKKFELFEGGIALPTKICGDKLFERAALSFCKYAEKRFGKSFAEGEGGIALILDEKLPYEGYKIEIGESFEVFASSHKGMNNALSCLLSLADEDLTVRRCRIEDAPDVPYRSFMLDTARYPHRLELLYQYVDLCYMNRASYFQIHFSDNENFTIQFPEYSKVGGKYSFDELRELAKYADDRGITIIPEIDVPGHSRILTNNYPEIFGSCGIMSASETTFDALRGIYAKLCELFPNSPYIHIGGDEASISEWESCEPSQAYMKEHGIESIEELYAEYVRRVTEIIFELGRTPIVWEGFSEKYNDRISKDVIVVGWESLYQPAYQLAKGGFRLINCSWKPLYIVVGWKYWQPEDIMKWDIWSWNNWWEKSLAYPDGFKLEKGSAEILGGQICAWGDSFGQAPDREAMCDEEFTLVSERLPALCERTWNAFADND